MPTKIPTFAEVEALRLTWYASSDLNCKNLNAYEAAKKAHEAGPDTQQILDEAVAARDAAFEAYNVARAAAVVASKAHMATR
jgi:hypothetical protein